MGSFFNINFEYFDGFQAYIDKYGKHKLYPFVLDGKNNINDIEFKSPYALIFGNEATGLAKDFRDIGESVYIPHTKDVDSLNLSIATGIALFKAKNSGKISK
jgi:TrmH family RNA methyltransferase